MINSVRTRHPTRNCCPRKLGWRISSGKLQEHWQARPDGNRPGQFPLIFHVVYLVHGGKQDRTFAAGTPLTATGADGILTTGGFNKEGKLDFVAVNGQVTHTLTMFLGNGDGTFRSLAPVIFSDTGTPSAVHIQAAFTRATSTAMAS